MLLPVAGKPLIQHVYERARASLCAEVLIATDDERIKLAAEGFGATVVMTSPACSSGTERIAEVCAAAAFDDEDVVVNVQGDEPQMPGAVIDQVAAALISSKDDMATVAERITEQSLVFDPNVVKVAMDAHGYALLFSRAPLPWDRDRFPAIPLASQLPGELPGQLASQLTGQLAGIYYRHVGLYAYRVGFLKAYVQMPVCELEMVEGLEQLRALYHGARIRVLAAVQPTGIGIDTATDLARFENMAASANSS